MTPDTDSTANEKPLTAGALRMRATRRRRKEGLRCITIELRETEVDQLVANGLLNAAEREKENAVLLALYTVLDGAFGDMHQ
jgi:hypothetical protein